MATPQHINSFQFSSPCDCVFLADVASERRICVIYTHIFEDDSKIMVLVTVISNSKTYHTKEKQFFEMEKEGTKVAKLTYNFDSAFVYDISKQRIKKALKKELLSSFEIEENKNTLNMIEYLTDNFFWEFFDYFQDELLVLFESQARDAYCEEEML